MNITKAFSDLLSGWLRLTTSTKLELQGLHPLYFPMYGSQAAASCQSSEAWLWAAAPTHRADATPLNQFISHQLLINNPSISSLRSCPEWVYNKLRVVAESFIDTRRNQIFIIKQLLVWKCDQLFCPPVYKSLRLRAESHRLVFKTSNTRTHWSESSNRTWNWCKHGDRTCENDGNNDRNKKVCYRSI